MRARFALVLMAGLMLSACAGEALRKAQYANPDPAGQDSFLVSLHREYVDLAEHAYYAGRQIDSHTFSRKARMAADGQIPAPSEPTGFRVPSDVRPDLQAAYDRLMAAFTAKADSMDPRRMARAQTMYDCWLAEERALRGSARAEMCKTQFSHVLFAVENTLYGPDIDIVIR